VSGTDVLGQQYFTPEQVLIQGSDIIIIGRGIMQAQDPRAAAKEYKNTGWRAYQSRK
jgi:uridine monophosphate synthetase